MESSYVFPLPEHELLKTGALINGEWIESGQRYAVTNPANGQELARVVRGDAALANAAVEAAEKASSLAPHHR